MARPLTVAHHACSHVGRRPNNEDALGQLQGLGLFVVADGMGGYEGGEVASALTVQTLHRFLRSNAQDEEVTWPYAMDRRLSLGENLISVGLRLAHQAICARRQGRHKDMGSTVAVLLLCDGEACVGHVGDSRVYRLRDGQLQQLTRDHSLYAELRAAGAADLPPRREFPYNNVVTRALGTPCAQPDVSRQPALAGDRYLLCTDGLTDVLTDEELMQVLAAHPPPLAPQALVDRAYDAGGKDNITALLVTLDAAGGG